jgi:hypothetical protein
MKYERLASASGAALSLLLLAGCGEQDVHNSKAELPANVRQQVGGHVLQLVYEDAQGKVNRATAVRVSVGKHKTVDITAAHALAPAVEHCADQDVVRKTGSAIEHFTPLKQSSR